MKQERTEPAYDVFVSYTHQDQEWVRKWLLPRLEEAGLTVCADFRDFAIGIPTIVNIEQAVALSRFTLLVLSPDYLHSEWVDWEAGLVKTLDPAERQRHVIPILHRPCRLPMRIATLSYVDFTRPSQVEPQLDRLLVGLGAKSRSDTERAPTATPKEPKEYNTIVIRELLLAVMSDEELKTFCFDYFRDVYDYFTTGMSRGQKAQVLIEYCQRRGSLDSLLAAVKEANPTGYSVFEQRLKQQ